MSTATPRPPKTYEGQAIAVTFDAARCLHAAECVRGAPDVFDTGRRPWIVPDGAAADHVAEVVRRCPSGALSYELVDGPAEPPLHPTRVSASPDGPLWVRGDVVVEVDGQDHHVTRAALCSCGASDNAPFCDSSGACEGARPPTTPPTST